MTTKQILEDYKTVAVVGMSKNHSKPANEVPILLHNNGYNIIPINPTADEIDGLKSYKSIADVPEKIEILDVFRPSEDAIEITKQAIARHKEKGDIKVIWLQLGILNDEAKKLAEENGIDFIQDKCMKIEFNKYF